MLNKDPTIDLLEIDDYQMKPKMNIDLLEPWQEHLDTFLSQPIKPIRQIRIIMNKTPQTRQQRRKSIETQPNNSTIQITRPASCHNGMFQDLGFKTIPQSKFSKAVEQIFERAKTPRKNSTYQYRQICIKNIINTKIRPQRQQSLTWDHPMNRKFLTLTNKELIKNLRFKLHK
ncbi:hypothetical protein pb186bvf_001566 [Paramecium bursaria]